MLKGIDPLLNADVLHALRAMGHGDEIIVADANFPAHSIAVHTILGHPLRIDADAPAAIAAILSVYPLDDFLDGAASRMEVVGKPLEIAPVQREAQKAVNSAEGREVKLTGVERFAFYEKAKGAYCIIQTLERRFYGCFAFRKGVIAPSADFGKQTGGRRK
jgi:L-fucose mutarotase